MIVNWLNKREVNVGHKVRLPRRNLCFDPKAAGKLWRPLPLLGVVLGTGQPLFSERTADSVLNNPLHFEFSETGAVCKPLRAFFQPATLSSRCNL